MSFDADRFRAALEPWSFTVRGRRFVAAPVSTPAVLAFHSTMSRPHASSSTHRRALYRLLRRAFPWRFSYLWRGDPVRLLRDLEPVAREAALADFFRSLERKPRTPLELHRTPGTSSPPRTPGRAA